jgi:hypothetical protein
MTGIALRLVSSAVLFAACVLFEVPCTSLLLALLTHSTDEVVDGEGPPQPKPMQPAAAKKGKKRAKKGSDDDDDDDDDEDFSGGASTKKKRGGGGGGGGGGGFAKPIPISDDLAAAVGEKEMSRGALTKWVYSYAKEKDLMVRTPPALLPRPVNGLSTAAHITLLLSLWCMAKEVDVNDGLLSTDMEDW